MCYSAEVSFATWAFGMLSAAFLASQGKPFAFPLAVTQMQLIEGLRWMNAVDERVLAVLGKLVLGLQPAAGFYEAGATELILPYVVIQGLLEILYGSRDLRFLVAGDGHFRWKWLESSSPLSTVVYWAGLAYVGFALLPLWLNGLILGLYAYYTLAHGEYKTEGSLWCVSVNVLWLYYLIR